MDNRIIFREILGDIRRAADEAGGVITKEEIKERLSHLPLGEDHLKMIYQYLSEQGIQVPDDAQEAAELPTGEEGFALSIYLEELQQLAEREDEDETELLKAVAAGEAQAREKLIRWYLPLICEMAGEYKGDEIAAEDLIQEGNVGLLMAMESLNEFENAAASQAHLLNSVNEAMQAAIHANEETKKRNEDVVSQVNHLDEAIKNLERDLERKVSAEELSAYLDHFSLFSMAYSWGGFESLILANQPEHIAAIRPQGKVDFSGTLIRLHIGLENVDDLIADLAAVFARIE